MFPATSVVNNIGEEAVKTSRDPQKTPIKTARTHRIFNQTPQRDTIRSPQKILQGSEITQLNSTRYRSPQSCNLYYKQQHGLIRSSIPTSISPQKLTLIKSNQILEYENTVLLKQLQQRDDIIHMYKNGFSPNSTPFNDNIIKNLNLRLSQKNVLIQQIHRNLVEFSQKIAKQKIQIHPFCSESMKIILDLIEQHEHYPIIIRERIIDTSRSAERVYIREDGGHDWQIKLEKSYEELLTIKQRLEWFERQNNILESTITGLKVQRQSNTNSTEDPNYHKIQVQKLTNDLIIMQQQTSNYKHQINNLTQTIAELNKNINKPTPIPPNNTQITRLRQEIKKYQQKVLQLSEKDKEIIGLKEIMQRFKNQIVVYRTKEVKIESENMQMKGVIDELRSQLENKGKRQNPNNLKLDQQYKIRMSELQKQLQYGNMKINQLLKQNKICSEQATKWRKHLQQAQNYIEQLLDQLQLNKKPNPQQTPQQTIRLTQQITNLLQSLQNLRSQCTSLKQQQNRMYQTSEHYKVQIKQYTSRVENLMKERDDEVRKWQDIVNKKNVEYSFNLQEVQTRVRRQSQGLISNLRRQIENMRNYRQNDATKIKSEYQTKIIKLTQQIQNTSKELNMLKSTKSSKQWQKQLKTLHQDYQIKLKQAWNKLARAQDYIFTMQQKTKSQISSLKSSLTQIQFQNENLKKSNNKDKDEYRYKIDSKYSEVQSKLLALSQKNTQTITAQAQFWEQYRIQRKKDLEQFSVIIGDSLNLIGNVDQAVIVKRDQLYRLDFTELEQILRQISKLKQSKQQLNNSARQNIQTKFYGLLRTVSTQIVQ